MKKTSLKTRVDRGLAGLVILLMAANVLNVLWQVFTRFVLKDPSTYTEELARYLLIWVGLLGASYAAGQKMHLAIDLLQARLGAFWQRRTALLVQALVFCFALSVMVIGGIRLVWITLRLDQTSAALGIKLGYVYLALPLSGLLIIFYSLCFILDNPRPAPDGEDA